MDNPFENLPIEHYLEYETVKDGDGDDVELPLLPAVHSLVDMKIALEIAGDKQRTGDFMPLPKDVFYIYSEYISQLQWYVRPDILAEGMLKAVHDTFDSLIDQICEYADRQYNVSFQIQGRVDEIIKQYKVEERKALFTGMNQLIDGELERLSVSISLAPNLPSGWSIWRERVDKERWRMDGLKLSEKITITADLLQFALNGMWVDSDWRTKANMLLEEAKKCNS